MTQQGNGHEYEETERVETMQRKSRSRGESPSPSPRERRPPAKYAEEFALYSPRGIVKRPALSSDKSQKSRLDSLLEAALSELSSEREEEDSEENSVRQKLTELRQAKDVKKGTPKAPTNICDVKTTAGRPEASCSTAVQHNKRAKGSDASPAFEFEFDCSATSQTTTWSLKGASSTITPPVMPSAPAFGPATPSVPTPSQPHVLPPGFNLTPPSSPPPTPTAVAAAAAAAAAARLAKRQTWISGQDKTESAVSPSPTKSDSTSPRARVQPSANDSSGADPGQVSKDDDVDDGDCSGGLSPRSEGSGSVAGMKVKRKHGAERHLEEGSSSSAKRVRLGASSSDEVEAEYERSVSSLEASAAASRFPELGKLNLRMACWCLKKNQPDKAERCIQRAWDAFSAICHKSVNMTAIAESFVTLLKNNGCKSDLITRIQGQMATPKAAA